MAISAQTRAVEQAEQMAEAVRIDDQVRFKAEDKPMRRKIMPARATTRLKDM